MEVAKLTIVRKGKEEVRYESYHMLDFVEIMDNLQYNIFDSVKLEHKTMSEEQFKALIKKQEA